MKILERVVTKKLIFALILLTSMSAFAATRTHLYSEASGASSCSGYYKAYQTFNEAGELIRAFISNGTCRDRNREFPVWPAEGLGGLCSRMGGDGNYNWTTDDFGYVTGVECRLVQTDRNNGVEIRDRLIEVVNLIERGRVNQGVSKLKRLINRL